MSDTKQEPPRLCLACNADSLFGPLYLYPETGMGKGEVFVATSGSARAFGKVRTVPIKALACRQCGNLQLIAADQEALYEQWSAEQHQG
ncbi:hypothetical protein ACIQH5_12685 [Paenarthrobacter sp. NPDC091711]|uniref:hypothetical protein n=1 Tax=Paenarthrobacter sp. NPDC091711 TaxID=3364385 RepID=UPI00381445CE